jgi:hypothetical protein
VSAQRSSPAIQIGLSLIKGFEAQTLQWCFLSVADAALHLPFPVRMPDAAGQGRRSIMLEHVTIKRVQRRIVNIGSDDSLPQIVEHHDFGDPAQPAKSFLVQLGPDLRTGAEHEQPNRFTAVTECQYEQPRPAVLAALRVADHRAFAVIDLRLFARCGFDDGAGFRWPVSLEFPDEAPDTLISGAEAATVHQVLPDRHGVAATR